MGSRAIANFILGMVLLGVFVAIGFLALRPWYMFGLGRSSMLKVGYITSSESGI